MTLTAAPYTSPGRLAALPRPETARRHSDPEAVAGLALAAVALALGLWGRVGDAVVDYGRDPYTAWQMAAGRRLYADLAYPYGPLAPFLNLAAFRVAGFSLHTLTVCNLLTAAVVFLVQHRLMTRLWGSRTATAASVAWALVFGFGNATRLANYNFLTPYTNSATYGYACCVATVALLCAACDRGRPLAWAAAGGAAAGLAALTKVEFLLAAAATAGAGVVAVGLARRLPAGQWARLAAAVLGGAVTSVGLALAAMSLHTPARDVVAGTAHAYLLAFDPRLRGLESFQVMAGTDFVRRNATKAVVFFCQYLQVFLPPALVGLLLRDRNRRRVGRALAPALAVAAFAWITWGTFHFKFWQDLARGVPLLIAAWLAGWTWALVRAARRPSHADATASAARQWLMAVFALAMLARMALNFRLYQMGFVQAAPAAMVLIGMMFAGVPALLERLGGYGGLVRWTAAGLFAAVAANALATSAALVARHTATVGTGPDALQTDPTHAVVATALADLAARARPGDTLATLPEGPLLNYLSRRPNPTPYELLNDFGTVLAGGDASLVAAFDAHPPDWVLVVGGSPDDPPGSTMTSLAPGFQQWVRDHYARVSTVTSPPPTDPGADRREVPVRIFLYHLDPRAPARHRPTTAPSQPIP